MKKYIVIGNGVEWCEASWEGELKENKDLIFCNEVVPYNGIKFLKKMCQLHYNKKINSRIKLPFKQIWYKNFFDNLQFNESDEYIFIVYDWSTLSFDFSFLEYLRNICYKVTIVYIFTNVVHTTGAKYYRILDRISHYYDLIYAFDPLDAEKYGFFYSPLIYTRSDWKENVPITSDLFYVGQAKDRYEQLIEIYEIAKESGLTCDFHIVGVPEEKQKYKSEISYNQFMKYSEIIEHIKSSACLVDATQGNSSGFTIKVSEAVIYNKKLVSTNPHIKKADFFNEKRILCYPFIAKDNSMKDFLQAPSVTYSESEKNFFSPRTLFAKIEADRKLLSVIRN